MLQLGGGLEHPNGRGRLEILLLGEARQGDDVRLCTGRELRQENRIGLAGVFDRVTVGHLLLLALDEDRLARSFAGLLDHELCARHEADGRIAAVARGDETATAGRELLDDQIVTFRGLAGVVMLQ